MLSEQQQSTGSINHTQIHTSIQTAVKDWEVLTGEDNSKLEHIRKAHSKRGTRSCALLKMAGWSLVSIKNRWVMSVLTKNGLKRTTANRMPALRYDSLHKYSVWLMLWQPISCREKCLLHKRKISASYPSNTTGRRVGGKKRQVEIWRQRIKEIGMKNVSWCQKTWKTWSRLKITPEGQYLYTHKWAMMLTAWSCPILVNGCWKRRIHF